MTLNNYVCLDGFSFTHLALKPYKHAVLFFRVAS